MFTFIHAADIHLDSPLRGLSQHEEAPVDEIRAASRRALENLVELAIDQQIAFLIIAGDLYDGDWPDYNTGLFFNQQMRKLKDQNIAVYIITGNHDAESKITKSLKPPENVSVFSTKKPESIQHPNLPITLHGQGFATQSVSENLAIDYPDATPDHFNIGILHTSLAGNPQHDTYAPCSIGNLNAKQYDYWALGHIHQHAILQEDPPIVYSGNPQGRHIKELGERGCYLISIDPSDNSPSIHSIQFKPLDVVRWESESVDISSCRSSDEVIAALSATMKSSLSRADDRLLALRINLTGNSPLHDELISNHSHWQAECTNLANEIDDEKIWFEQLKIKTSPTYDPKELAKQDELTSLVIHALDDFDPSTPPPQADALITKLSGINDPELQKTVAPSAPGHLKELSQDVAAIVLHSISISGKD